MPNKFDYVKQYDATDKTVPFSFENIFYGVTFYLKPLEANYNPELKKFALALSEEKGVHFTEIFDHMDVAKPEHREIIVDLLAGSIIAGWEGLKDNDGNIVEYSLDAAKELTAVLPQYAIQKILLHALDISNFIKDPLRVDDLLKN